jgi:hypothetical protein
MLTRPNVSEPFQIAAILVSSHELAHAFKGMKANQMPPVEKKSWSGMMQKSPAERGFSSHGIEWSACFCDVGGLRSLLTLNYLELDLIALCKRFETGSTDRAKMDKDVRATFA